MSTTKHFTRVQIRWMIRRDMPEVLAIEQGGQDFPWSEEDFLTVLRKRDRIGMVAERDDAILGFMIYQLQKRRLQVLNFAVHPEFRRQGVGSQMVAKLRDKIYGARRSHIVLPVRETALDAQLFFKASGFRATEVLRACFDDTGEDAYLMRLSR